MATALAPEEGTRGIFLQTARRQIPPVLAAAGVLTAVFAVVNAVALPDEAATTWVINVVFAPVFLILAWVLRRGQLPDTALPWIWTMCSVALVGMLLHAYAQMPTAANLAYVVLVMIVFGPLTHAWLPFALGAVVMEIGAVATFSAVVTPVEVRENSLVCASALLVGAILLQLRLSALSDLADMQVELARQAAYDPLTEVLNRNGLERAIPAFLATAQRTEEPVLAWFVDVRGLKKANDRLGHRFGDELLSAVARALRSCIRTNDLLVRWGGDEFLVLGTGSPGAAADLNARVDRMLAADAAITDRWKGSVTVGFASAPAVDGPAGLDELIARADQDMYRRRATADGPLEQAGQRDLHPRT